MISTRFRGFLPVVVDLETGGFNAKTDALLEIAAVLLTMDEDGTLRRGETVSYHVQPFPGANLEPAALQVTGIDPFHPLRPAISERDALQNVFREVRQAVKDAGCKRAILVAHNAHFDLGFLNEAIARTAIKRSPFHPFSVLDTATLCGSLRRRTDRRAVLRDRQPLQADLCCRIATTGGRRRNTGG
jgi:ribonuclease T